MNQKRVRAAAVNLADINVALALYHNDTGSFPSQEEGLAVLLRPAGPGLSPYITGIPTDPWGTPYRYRLIEGLPTIDSAGPDGVFGTADDVQGDGHR